MMRVTQSMLTNNFLRNLNQSTSSLERLQNQLSTGKKVSKPSDDPVVAVRSIQYNSHIKELQQYNRNLDMAVSWMDTTDSAMQEVNDLFKSINEKMVQASSGTLDPDSRLAIAKELGQLKEQLGSIANTSIAGRFIFAGSNTDQQPYNQITDPSDPSKTIGAFTNTNTSKIPIELGKQIFVDMNVNGADLFGYKDPDTGKNIFEFLDQAVSTLNSPTGNINSMLGHLQSHENNFLRVHASLGANQNRVEMIGNRLSDQISITTELLSNEEDADEAEVITNLNMQENVHRLALGTGARIMQPSLMDFLR